MKNEKQNTKDVESIDETQEQVIIDDTNEVINEDETQDYIDKFALFEETAQRLEIHLPVAYRIIMRSYIAQGLIPVHEYDEVLRDIAEQKESKFNTKVAEIFSSLLGLLVFPLLVKKIENETMKLNFEGDEEKFQQAYKKRLFDNMLNSMN